MHHMKQLDTYQNNLDYREGLRKMKAKMDPIEYLIEYRRADRRVQQSKKTLRSKNIDF